MQAPGSSPRSPAYAIQHPSLVVFHVYMKNTYEIDWLKTYTVTGVRWGQGQTLIDQEVRYYKPRGPIVFMDLHSVYVHYNKTYVATRDMIQAITTWLAVLERDHQGCLDEGINVSSLTKRILHGA